MSIKVFPHGHLTNTNHLNEMRFKSITMETSFKVNLVLVSAQCGLVPLIENGFFSTTDFNIGSVAVMVCYPGYIPNGDTPKDITCQDSSTWSSATATCILSPKSSYGKA